MQLKFKTNCYNVNIIKDGGKIISVNRHEAIACIGSFLPLKKEDLKRYVKTYPIHWIFA